MIPYLIIIGCLILLIPYLKTKTYLSVSGIVILLIGILLVYLRISALKIYPSRFFVRETFWLTGLVVGVFTVVIISAFIILKKDKISRLKSPYFWQLLGVYFFWGFLQQVLFQCVFFETIYFISEGNIIVSLLLSAVYYGSFHLGLYAKRFFPQTLLLGFIFSGIYLIWGNIFWLGLSHALLGTFLYVLFFDHNELARQLSIKTND